MSKSSSPTYRKISSVFLAEFDNVAGPRNNICIQPYSVKPVPIEVFEKVYEFLIPKRSLYGQIVSVQIDGVTFIGKPTQVEGSQYERNAYLFNIGFLLESLPQEHPFLVRDMVPVVLKLSNELLSLEKERGLLSRQDWQSRTTLRTKLTKMVNQLFEKGCHFLVFDASHACYLKVLSRAPSNSQELSGLVNNSQHLRLDHVPVAIRAPMLVGQFASQIDPNVSQVSVHINGVNCIDQIASLTILDRETVFRSIGVLLDADMIRCIDIFRFQNRYEPTSKLHFVKEDIHFWEQCDRLVQCNSQSLFGRIGSTNRQSPLFSSTRKQSGVQITESFASSKSSLVLLDTLPCSLSTGNSNVTHHVPSYYSLYNSLSRMESVEQLKVDCIWYVDRYYSESIRISHMHETFLFT
ncbi:uncharacterized protein Gasu_04610 [Galdieria sulphuraria]|uniref:Nitrogen permease regulator 2-like protein n=1 Tax=Galdieria sulphuraria TaxID=130081 RepID=M2X7A3_GALSU|nr:uncharacterized protein Gasu_04610 [Galdieria sulphuraria]EME32370.1 hypothetical protein Gasu_04610 [Galdieria sulphuraria]|eukprot:XP_005708890.1 hypothetical protein Gasu_04610 [Galdieria sulphuraria]